MNNYLVLLRVVQGIMPLDHVATTHFTGEEIWRDLINDKQPEETRSLRVIVPGQRFVLSLQNYRNRGGVTNAGFGRWLEARGMAEPGTLLLFDVSVDDAHNVIYSFVGRVHHV